MKTVTAYKCDFCKRLYLRKGNAGKHERECYNNPAARTCNTCKLASKECIPFRQHLESPMHNDWRRQTNCEYHMVVK